MNNTTTGTDTMRSFLVLAATIGVIIFNWLAATGRLAGTDTAAISAKYQTLVTPAGYAFSIWTLIYVGLVAFSVFQAAAGQRCKVPSGPQSVHIYLCLELRVALLLASGRRSSSAS
jgi:hypothetical protein